jgi:hypothetical protein
MEKKKERKKEKSSRRTRHWETETGQIRRLQGGEIPTESLRMKWQYPCPVVALGRARPARVRISGASWVIALVLLILGGVVPALAQSDALQLFVRRNFGYSGGSQIQGSFRMEGMGPADLASVTFKIDQQVVGTSAQAPYRVDFNTDAYSLGWHTLSAEGQTTGGRRLTSAARRFEFVSAAQGQKAGAQIALPLLAVVGLALLVGAGVSLFQIRRAKNIKTPLGAPRKYGLFGGAICPKCGRPFSRHWWGLNAGLGKFDRCDHCGKWSIVRALPQEQLRAAEAAEVEQAKSTIPVPEISAAEKLRRQLDDSRFERD